MDQDYIRSRYGGETREGEPVGPAPAEPAGFAGGIESHLPHLNFGGDGSTPWYEERWAIAVFVVLLGPFIGFFVWWVITRYDIETRVKLIAAGLSVLLTLIVALLW